MTNSEKSVRVMELILGGPGFNIAVRIPKRYQRDLWLPAVGIAIVAGTTLASWVAQCAETRDARREVAALGGQMAEMRSELMTIRSQNTGMSEKLEAVQHDAESREKELAHAIAQKINQSGQPAKTSKEQLARRTMVLVRRIREMHEKQRAESVAALNAAQMQARNFNVEQLRESVKQFGINSDRLCSAHEFELRMRLLGEMQYVYQELENRVRDLPAPESTVRLALTGHLSGLEPLMETANYLEVAAKKLQ